jgi:hypothetical protein
MARHFNKMLTQDFNLGTGTGTKKNPGGGDLTGTQVGLHSWAEGLAKTTVTWDPASVPAGQSVTNTVTVPGAALGDKADAWFSLSLAGLILTAYVSDVNTVTVVLSNPTTAAVDLASGSLHVLVFKVR